MLGIWRQRAESRPVDFEHGSVSVPLCDEHAAAIEEAEDLVAILETTVQGEHYVALRPPEVGGYLVYR